MCVPLPAVDDEELVERCIAAARMALKTTKDMPIATVVRAVLAIAAPHYTQQGWEKGREQALKPLRGWRESDWPAGFCRWTAQTLADHVVERVRTMKQET